MSITRSNRKVVDAVDAALAIRNKQNRVPGSLEYPWYLPYNILLNNLVADSDYVAINAQHAFTCSIGGKNDFTRIPDYVVLYTNVSRDSKGGITGINSTACAVVEIKPLTKIIPKEDKGKGTEVLSRTRLLQVQKQIVMQAHMALHLSPNQDTVIVITAVGQFWKFLVYKRNRTKIAKDGLPIIENTENIIKRTDKSRKGGVNDNLVALVRKGSELSEETIKGCEELKKELKKIVGESHW